VREYAHVYSKRAAILRFTQYNHSIYMREAHIYTVV